MQLTNTRYRNAPGGFTLLEVLVALIVLSIGLLGLSGLQTSSLRNNHSAFLRSQATLVATDILDRMRANRNAAVDGDYDISYGTTPTSGNCTSNCAPDVVADMDLAAWISYVQRLPGGQGEIDVSQETMTTAGGDTYSVEVAEIRVRWNDARGAAPLEIITRSAI